MTADNATVTKLPMLNMAERRLLGVLVEKAANNGQKYDDAGAHRNDIGDSRRSQRNKERESSLRPVGRRAEGIETKNGNSGGGSDLFCAFVGSGERFSEQEIQNGHDALPNSLR